MARAADPLLDVTPVVRRVIAARIRDRHLVEDLTQEALVRVASAQHRLTDDTLRAYAIVTARNLVYDHARTEHRRGRHAHRLVEYRSLEGPEEVALEREETDALAVALGRLDEDDRRLLLQHEADGDPLAGMAAVENVSPGALAMRLARARAQLRVEFLLAFRRATLPSTRCRAVLLAISAGDRRRQESLHAAEHLVSCPACSALSRPLAERRRGIAIWAGLAGALEIIRRLLRQRSVQVTAAVGVAGATVLGVAMLRDDPAPPPVVAAAPAPTTAAPAPAPSPTTAAPVPTTPAPAPTTTPPAPTTALVVDHAVQCPPVLTLADLGPDGPFDCPVLASGLVIESVSAEEALWVRTPAGGVLWVQLTGAGESPLTFAAGQVVDLSGATRGLPPDPTTLGVTPDELERLRQAGVYLEVTYEHIAITSD